MRQKAFTLIGSLLRLGLLAPGVAHAEPSRQDPTPSGPSTPTLTGVTWQWTYFSGGRDSFDVPAPENYTITFLDDGTFHAQADCNSLSGTYMADDTTITIEPGPSTEVACPPGSLGEDFVRYLSQVVIYSFTGDSALLLEAPYDSGVLTLTAAPQVRGNVSYRERIALPDDAVVRVQLIDVTAVDAPTIILGEQVIVTGGAQVPFAFAVPYDAAGIDDARRYGVVAQITDREGRLLFVTDRPTPVITGGNPVSGLDLMLVRVGGRE